MGLLKRIAISLDTQQEREWYVVDARTHGDSDMVSVGLSGDTLMESDRTYSGTPAQFVEFVAYYYPHAETIYLDGESFRQEPAVLAETMRLFKAQDKYQVEVDE